MAWTIMPDAAAATNPTLTLSPPPLRSCSVVVAHRHCRSCFPRCCHCRRHNLANHDNHNASHNPHTSWPLLPVTTDPALSQSLMTLDPCPGHCAPLRPPPPPPPPRNIHGSVPGPGGPHDHRPHLSKCHDCPDVLLRSSCCGHCIAASCHTASSPTPCDHIPNPATFFTLEHHSHASATTGKMPCSVAHAERCDAHRGSGVDLSSAPPLPLVPFRPRLAGGARHHARASSHLCRCSPWAGSPDPHRRLPGHNPWRARHELPGELSQATACSSGSACVHMPGP